MAHFAKLDENNFVIEINSVSNSAIDKNNEEQSGIEFLTLWSNGHSNWKQTSYNGKIRKQYAGIGYFYDIANDVFIAPRPFESWTLDKNFDWVAPVKKPIDGKRYFWNESELKWDEASSL